MHSWTLYQTESLELLRLNYHHLNATFLDPSALLLLSYVWVTASSSTLTRPTSLQVWQMFAQTVEWHHTPLNICSTALHARHNWQFKTYGTIQTSWLIFSSSTTTNEEEELWTTTTTTTTWEWLWLLTCSQQGLFHARNILLDISISLMDWIFHWTARIVILLCIAVEKII